MITVCPNCQEEFFDVIVLNSGSYFDPDIWTVWWQEGDGQCLNEQCGFKGWHSDTSA